LCIVVFFHFIFKKGRRRNSINIIIF